MELPQLLAAIEAPAELLAWVEGMDDFEAAWDRCERGDERVWIAAAAGVPIETVIEGAAAAVLTVIDTLSEVQESVTQAIELAVSGADGDELRAVADACELIASGHAGDYRRSIAPGHAAAAAAAALVARAAEGQQAGEAIREAARLERSRSVGVMIGMGTSGALPPREGAARLSVFEAAADPAQGSFLFAIAASAQAIVEAARAVALGTPDPERSLVTATLQLDGVVKGTIEESLNLEP